MVKNMLRQNLGTYLSSVMIPDLEDEITITRF